MPPPLLPLPHPSSFAVNSVDFFAVRLLSLADEDVAAASLLSGSFLHQLAIAASLLPGSFLRRLTITAIPKIQRCPCRSPPSSSPPPSSRRFLSSSSSPLPTRMSLPPLFPLVLSFVDSPSLPLFSLVLSFVDSLSPPSPRSSAAISDLLPLPLLHRPAVASCSSPAMPLLFASSPPSTFFFSFSVDLCASSSSAFCHCRLPVFHPHQVHWVDRFMSEPNVTELFWVTCRSGFMLESDRFGLRVPVQPAGPVRF